MRWPWLIPLLASATLAQPPEPEEKEEPIPVEVALEATGAAYTTRPVADEVTIRFRAPGAGDRTDTFVIRLQPGGSPRSGPSKVFLDLGPLKILCEGGKAMAINTNAPGKYAMVEYAAPLHPGSLDGFLPPVPLPQLAFASGDLKIMRAPTPYTRAVTWTLVTPDLTTRPPTATITGSGPDGPVTLVTNAETGRIMKLTATIHGRSGDSTLELTSRPVDPGDPAAWGFRMDGRDRAASIAELRPTPPKRDTQVRAVPDLQCTRPDMGLWGLRGALTDAEPRSPLVVLIFFHAGVAGVSETIMGDAQAGLSAMEQAQADPEAPKFRAVAAAAIEPGELARDRWEQARREWERPASLFAPAKELMWAPGGMSFIERFAPGGNAVIVVVGPDQSLRAAINLNGRFRDAGAIAAELRGALKDPPNKDAAPEAPR